MAAGLSQSGKDGSPSPTLWQGLTSEPHTGVAIVALDGKLLYLNEQSATIFFGHGTHASQIIGKYLHEVFPRAWVEQRLALFRRVLVSGQPIMIRSIWRGWQQFSWIHHIDRDATEMQEDRDAGLLQAPDHFLVITRRIAGDGHEPLTPNDFNLVESDVVNLGSLEILSPRELEVLALLGQGMSLKEVAKTLHRSVKTIDNHRQAIGRKLEVDDRVHLAEIARRAGLTVMDAERTRVSHRPI